MPKLKNNFLVKLYRFLIYIAPAVLFFSYYPNIHLGANSSMNFELSLPLIWLVIFDFTALILIIRNHKLNNIIKYWPWLLFPVFLTISVLWSLNSLRGLLTVGILWLVYFAGFSLLQLKEYLKPTTSKKIFYKVFFYSTLAICVWCWLQAILDLVGIGRENTLMCSGCTTEMFGFPHPNGFAIEPQFMGNLLLAPTLVIMWVKINIGNWKKWFKGLPEVTTEDEGASPVTTGASDPSPKITFSITLILFIFSATLFLTFSRGAIYAFIIAAIFMTIYYMVYLKSARPLIIWPIIIVSFLFTLNFQGLFAELSHTSDTYSSGISKVLNHLSLGIINIPANSKDNEVPVQYLNATEAGPSQDENKKQDAKFDGYVESSTTTRVMLNDLALELWAKDPTTVLFGVGIGGAGQALYLNGKMYYASEIIQNQYFSLLLETGLIGLGLFIFTLILAIKNIFKSTVSGLIYTLMVAYGITLCFFAGLPNALHIYLLPIMLLGFERN